MADEKKNDQVNVDFSKYLDLLDALDDMVEADDTDRSKLIRKLVREERDRRQGFSLPHSQPKTKKTDRAQAIPA